MMTEEPTTADLAEFSRWFADAWNHRDFDAIASAFAPDAVFTSHGIGSFDGRNAIRAFIEDWHAPFERLTLGFEEMLDLGGGVSFAVLVLAGSYVGSSADVHLRYASVSTNVNGLIVRVRNYTNIDEARTTAERLAQVRG